MNNGDNSAKKDPIWWVQFVNCHRIQFRVGDRMREGLAKLLSQWGLGAQEDPDLQCVARAVFLCGLDTLVDANPVKRHDMLAGYMSKARGQRGRPPRKR